MPILLAIMLIAAAMQSEAAAARSSSPEAELMRQVDALFSEGRPQDAIAVLQAAAAGGTRSAQAALAGLHFAGVHVAKDLPLAEKFLREAISDPRPAYKRDLACVLYHRGGDEHIKESIVLIEQAAAEDDVLAVIYESRLYRLGIGRTANPSFGNFKLERALSRIYEGPDVSAAESAFLREHVPGILNNGICGPSDQYGAFLAKSFAMRYRDWPTFGSRYRWNPMYQYLDRP